MTFKMLLRNTFLLCVVLLLISACHPNRIDDDDSATISSFSNGFFIANEGIAGDRDGSLSFYDRGQGKVFNDVYTSVNETALSGTLSSLSREGSSIAIVQNRVGQITYADDITLVNNGITTGFALPRFFHLVHPQKAYVSQWGLNGGDGSVQIVNPATRQIIGEISTANGPERMLQQGNYVYLSNSGGNFLDSIVTKIDINTDQIVKTIDIGLSPQSLQADANGAIWVLAKGLITFSETRAGVLVKLVNDQVAFSIPVPTGSRDLVINNNRNTLYFINGSSQKIYQHDINSSTLALVPFSEVPVTALGFDSVTNLLVGLDAQNFQVPGKLLLFDAEGKLADEFTVGYVPNYLAF